MKNFIAAIEWRRALLLSVVVLGIGAMTTYKVIAIPSEELPFILIVLFVEIAAGVAVFAQSLLRKVAEEQANKAFVFSIWFRLAVAVVGIAAFIEGGELNPESWLGWQAKNISWTGFLTYEIANGLMLLVEYMFSHLLSAEDLSFKQEYQNSKSETESLKAELEALEKVNQGMDAGLGILADWAANPSGDLEFDSAGLGDGVTAIVSDVQDAFVMWSALQENWEDLIRVSDGLVNAVESGRFELDEATLEDPGTWARHLTASQSLVDKLEELRKLKKLVSNLAGKHMTVARNTRGFVCKSCNGWNEQNQSQQPVCSSCDTLNPKK